MTNDRRLGITFFLAAALVVFFVGLRIFRVHTGVVTLENRAQETVTHASLEVCGQRLSFGAIPSGESRAATFKLYGDSDYDVTVRFSSGREIRAQIGYATGGMDSTELIVIRPDTVVLEGE
jgi:hypothetical protein